MYYVTNDKQLLLIVQGTRKKHLWAPRSLVKYHRVAWRVIPYLDIETGYFSKNCILVDFFRASFSVWTDLSTCPWWFKVYNTVAMYGILNSILGQKILEFSTDSPLRGCTIIWHDHFWVEKMVCKLWVLAKQNIDHI